MKFFSGPFPDFVPDENARITIGGFSGAALGLGVGIWAADQLSLHLRNADFAKTIVIIIVTLVGTMLGVCGEQLAEKLPEFFRSSKVDFHGPELQYPRDGNEHPPIR